MRKPYRFSFLFIHFFVQFNQAILNIRRIVNSLRKHQYTKECLELVFSKTHQSNDNRIHKAPESKMILLDYFPFPHWLALSSMTANLLREKTGGSIRAFGFIKPFRNTKDLYEAFDVKKHLQISLGFTKIAEFSKLYNQVCSSITNPEDVFNLEIDKINLGIPIYESILRSGKITVRIDEIETYIQIYRGLMEYMFFKDLFSEGRIEAVIVSHDCYIGPGLLDHMAHRFGVPSINVNPFEINLPYEPGQLYKRFQRYPEYFLALEEEKRVEGVALAKTDLELRLSGKIGIKMAYQEKSAFESNRLKRQLVDTANVKVLVAAHDFYDNPQAYGEMLFHDFSIWLEFLNQVANETTYDWYLKCHKDSSLQQLREIEEFSRSHPRFTVVDPSVSFHQLAQEGLDFVLTCYGSVGHELPLLGINVLNSSFNPHIAYDFNLHAKNLDNYRELVLNLEELRNRKISDLEIYEFFYVHNYLMWPDNFIFPSYLDFMKITENNIQSDVALIYIAENYEDIEERLHNRLIEALKDRRVFSVERILESRHQLKHPISAMNRLIFDKFSN